MSGLKKPVKFDVNGERFTVVPVPNIPVEVSNSVVRTAMVSDTAKELTSNEAFTQASRTMMESVKRRGLRPRGAWVIGYLPVDWPLWRDLLSPEITDRVQAKLTEINGHVMIYALFDSADMTRD